MNHEEQEIFGELFTYSNWLKEEGVPVHKGYHVQDL